MMMLCKNTGSHIDLQYLCPSVIKIRHIPLLHLVFQVNPLPYCAVTFITLTHPPRKDIAPGQWLFKDCVRCVRSGVFFHAILIKVTQQQPSSQPHPHPPLSVLVAACAACAVCAVCALCAVCAVCAVVVLCFVSNPKREGEAKNKIICK